MDARMTGVASLQDTIADLNEMWFSDAQIVVVADASYAIYVEFGTANQRAQPYLRPALEHAAASIGRHAADVSSSDELVKVVGANIEEYAKRVVPVDTGYLRSQIHVVEDPSDVDGTVTQVSV